MAKSASSKKSQLALVGGETLLGKELADVLAARFSSTLVSFSASGEGNFGESDGEAVYLEPLSAATIAGALAVLIAGSAEGAEKAYELGKAAGGKLALIDCSGHLESRPETRIVAPLFAPSFLPETWLFEIAHPAASALALVLQRISRYRPLRQAIVSIFEPASELGKGAVSELHKQTTSLLAFKPIEKPIFDTQLTFNLLAQFGSEGKASLAAVEQRIERHLATLLAGADTATAIPMPSLRLIAAPVFHGYTISLWAEFEREISAQELAEALASAQIEIRGPNEEAPEPVTAAGQSGLIAGDIRRDRNNPRAAWLWIVGDNLRLTADAAADLVNSLEARQS